jgi:hypothetical protein
MGNRVSGQGGNDDCLSAYFISDIRAFCSEPGEFNNLNQGLTALPPPGCWNADQDESDVWFSFAPSKPGIFLKIFGSTDSNSETLTNYSIAVYEGDCFNPQFLLCSESSVDVNVLERLITDLVIGRLYYIRVSSQARTSGTFQLCIEEFNPVPSPEQDCDRAVILCDKSSFVVEFLQGGGVDDDEAEGSCLDVFGQQFPSETSSAWYKWTAGTSGTLTFTLTPNNTNDPEEDLDFALYRLPGGLNDCVNKELLRCMASGESQGNSQAQNSPCFGPTGLSLASTDFQENPGCSPGDDNFLAALDMIEGESYALIVNNFSRSGLGFKIDFGGSGEILGPEPRFEIRAQQAFECDKLIFFSDQSFSQTDPIVSYLWNFGEGAQPTFASGNQEHEVVYSSFGDKLVALTLETSQGCQVTEILPLRIEPCCADTSTLRIDAIGSDLICNGIPEGRIEVMAFNGSPGYVFRLDENDFQPSPVFPRLEAGAYALEVQDQKGCTAGISISLTEPPPLELTIFAQADTVDLGFGTQLSSNYSPPERNVTYQWIPPDGLSCSACPDPFAVPPGDTEYVLRITDEDGCESEESILIYTNFTTPVYAPNAVYVNSDAGNGFFRIYTNIAAVAIETLSVYDRWGGLLYQVENVDPSDPSFVGWNGRVGNKVVNPGVYTWVSQIRFLNDDVLTFAGDFVLFR